MQHSLPRVPDQSLDQFLERLLTALQHNPECKRYWVAYSGGLDSHVLLHMMAKLRETLAVDIRAVHVNHNLQLNAENWANHCKKICDGLSVPLTLLSVDANARPGESPEAAARDARYHALSTLLIEGDVLLTAHHQDDQAETMLLQLLRGCGPRGLAAMPAVTPFYAGYHRRPLLMMTRDELQAIASEQGLAWIEDPSNNNVDFSRNYIRHQLMPVIKSRWPSASNTIARSAALCAQAAMLIEQQAEEDYHYVCDDGETLMVSRLQGLNMGRQSELIRYWIAARGLPVPAARHIEQIFRCLQADQDRVPNVSWPKVDVFRYRQRLYVMPRLLEHDAAWSQSWQMAEALDGESLLMPVSVGRQLRLVSAQKGQGVAEKYLSNATLTVKFRQGGERCSIAGRAGSHSLKKLFHENNIFPWQRNRIPLIYIDDVLAVVVGCWVCEPFVAKVDQSAVTFILD